MTAYQTEATIEGERRSVECLRVYWPERVAPIDPVRIALRLGVTVKEAALPKELAGAVFRRPGQEPVILVSDADNESRKRFTVAHEIGHYIKRADSADINFVDLRSPLSATGDNTEEVFANAFAAGLLMPKEMVLKLWGKERRRAKADRREPEAFAIAAHFEVSLEAMTYRLKRLGLTGS